MKKTLWRLTLSGNLSGSVIEYRFLKILIIFLSATRGFPILKTWHVTRRLAGTFYQTKEAFLWRDSWHYLAGPDIFLSHILFHKKRLSYLEKTGLLSDCLMFLKPKRYSKVFMKYQSVATLRRAHSLVEIHFEVLTYNWKLE